MPYVSLSCRGPWCANFMRPCSLNPQFGAGVGDCGRAGLSCRKPWPGAGTDVPISQTGQLFDWLTRTK